MKKIIPLLIIAAAVYGLLNFHFILFDGRVKILKKVDLQLENTFVDARGEKQLKLFLEPDLLRAGINDVIDSTAKKLKK